MEVWVRLKREQKIPTVMMPEIVQQLKDEKVHL